MLKPNKHHRAREPPIRAAVIKAVFFMPFLQAFLRNNQKSNRKKQLFTQKNQLSHNKPKQKYAEQNV